MNKELIIQYVEKEIEKCRKHYNDSYNTQTRYKWLDKENMFEDIKRSVNNYNAIYEELSLYKQMDEKCKKKYGNNIAKQLGI